MIRYILVDDDQKFLNRVKKKLDNLPEDYGLKHIASYHSSRQAAEEIDPETYDLLIVDY